MIPPDTQTELPFLAGVDDEGEPIFESLSVTAVDEEQGLVRLLRSPLFARNLASGDRIKVINAATAEYRLEERSGNLSIRVFSKEDIDPLAETLTPALEKIDGALDLRHERALVYSIHYSIGFQEIEDTLNDALKDYPYAVWYYGNVYDPEDGTTPIGWWLDIDEQ